MTIGLRPAIVAVSVAGLAAAAGGVLYMRRQRSAARPDRPGRDEPPTVQTCECGLELRVTGTGRHTIVWAGEEAVLDNRCPACSRELALVGPTG